MSTRTPRRSRASAAVAPVVPAVAVAVALGLGSASAATAQAPAGYYDRATGTGETLKLQLRDVIDRHRVFSYDDANQLLQETDADPNKPGNILLVYDRRSVLGRNTSGWNREHTWPASRLNGRGAAYSDLHQLRPSTIRVNSDRGNLNFGGAFGSLGGSFGTVSDGGTKWYPGNADAGVIARQQFYMETRYSALDLLPGNPSASGDDLGDLDRLIEWHYEVAPDAFELNRNEAVFGLQRNRNPFIDRPELAWSVLVNQANDTLLTLDGAGVDASGGSRLDVNLGRVIVGAGRQVDRTVGLTKTGDDGTYYGVTTTGRASSSVSGRLNNLRTGGTDRNSLRVNLDTDAAGPGVYTGTVRVDNLDVTTAGGAGRGANDGDDVVSLSRSVLAHSNASFAAGADRNALAVDLGRVYRGQDTRLDSAEVFNFGGSVDPSLVAGLRSTGVQASGSTAAFATDFGGFTSASAPLAAGDSADISYGLDSSVAGSFDATYTLFNADEVLPGATAGAALSLRLTATVDELVPGDLNLDGAANSEDLPFYAFAAFDAATYRSFVGIRAELPGDLNADGRLDLDDARLAADTFVDPSGSRVDRANNFLDLDLAADVLDDGLVNGSAANFFDTATAGRYAAGDSFDDIASSAGTAGADGGIDTGDFTLEEAVLLSLGSAGPATAAALLGQPAVDADRDGDVDGDDLRLALGVDTFGLASSFDPTAFYTAIYGVPVPEPTAAAVLALGGLTLLRRRRAA